MSNPQTPNLLPWMPGWVPPVADPAILSTVTTAAGQVAEDISATAAKSVVPGTPAGGTDWLNTIESAARDSAQKAFMAALPAVQAQALKLVQAELAKELGGTEPTSTFHPGDLLKASARSRAIRSFFQGLALSIVWALVNIVGQFAGIDWFTKEGWITVGTLVVGTVAHAGLSYVSRVLFPPELAQEPGGG